MGDDRNELDANNDHSLLVRFYAFIFGFFLIYKNYLIILALSVVVYFVYRIDFSSVFEDVAIIKPVKSSYWNESYAQELILKSERQLNDAIHELEDNRLHIALELYRAVDNEFGVYSKTYKHELFTEQQTIREHYIKLLEPFQLAVIDLFEAEIDAMEISGLMSDNYRQLDADFYAILSDVQRNQLKMRMDRMDHSRANKALRSIRVIFEPDDSIYVGLLQAALRNAWNSKYGFELIFGKPLGEKEKRATFLTYKLVCAESFTVLGKSKRQDGSLLPSDSSSTFPIGLNIYLKAFDGPDLNYPTSWDRVNLFNLELAMPDKIEPGNNPFEAALRVKEINEEHNEILLNAVSSDLKVPTFMFFPGEEVSDVHLTTHLIDLGKLRKFAVNHPDEFIETSLKWIKDKSLSDSVKIFIVWLELNLTEFLHIVIADLPNLDSASVARLSKALAGKPWLDNYRLAFELYEHADDTTRVILLEAVAKNYHETVVKEKLFNLLSKADSSKDIVIARLILDNCSSEELQALRKFFLTINAEVASYIFRAVYNRDYDLAYSWMLEDLLSVPQPVQYDMIQIHSMNNKHRNTTIPVLFSIYKKAYEQVSYSASESAISQKLKLLILDEFKKHLYVSEVNVLARSLNLTNLPENFRILFCKELFKTRADRTSDDYYIDCLKLLKAYADMESKLHSSFEQTVRNNQSNSNDYKIVRYLINEILNKKNKNEQLKQDLLSFLADRTSDEYLIIYSLEMLDKHNWNWSQPEVVRLLEAGCRLSNKRFSCYSRIFNFSQEANSNC